MKSLISFQSEEINCNCFPTGPEMQGLKSYRNRQSGFLGRGCAKSMEPKSKKQEPPPKRMSLKRDRTEQSRIVGYNGLTGVMGDYGDASFGMQSGNSGRVDVDRRWIGIGLGDNIGKGSGGVNEGGKARHGDKIRRGMEFEYQKQGKLPFHHNPSPSPSPSIPNTSAGSPFNSNNMLPLPHQKQVQKQRQAQCQQSRKIQWARQKQRERDRGRQKYRQLEIFRQAQGEREESGQGYARVQGCFRNIGSQENGDKVREYLQYQAILMTKTADQVVVPSNRRHENTLKLLNHRPQFPQPNYQQHNILMMPGKPNSPHQPSSSSKQNINKKVQFNPSLANPKYIYTNSNQILTPASLLVNPSSHPYHPHSIQNPHNPHNPHHTHHYKNISHIPHNPQIPTSPTVSPSHSHKSHSPKHMILKQIESIFDENDNYEFEDQVSEVIGKSWTSNFWEREIAKVDNQDGATQKNQDWRKDRKLVTETHVSMGSNGKNSWMGMSTQVVDAIFQK